MAFTLRRRPVGGEIIASDDDNVDLWIDLDDGRVFSATFFTIKNLTTLMGRYRESGECARGTYFWATDMIVVESISKEIIEATIADLISRGEIESCFELLEPRRGDMGAG